MKTPILETSRLWLKPLKEEDAPGAFLWTGDPKVSWYMRYETHGSLEDTKQWLREEEKQLALLRGFPPLSYLSVSYTHLRAHET